MKRTVQMAKAGVPNTGTNKKKFKGFRGVGKPKRPWTPGPLIIECPNWRAREEQLRGRA